MTEDWIKSYIKAGKAVIAAKKLARELVEPRAFLMKIANRIELEIFNQGCELAFPTNISLNEIAAHYSPPIGDRTMVPNKGLLKIDIGAQYNGYIADSAFTININEDPKLEMYINAAKAGLNAAIEKFAPGIKLYELGEAIANEVIKYGLKPITNLGGHELKQYDLHAGPFIPNYKDTNHNTVLKPGDAYACEPFTTSGAGKVVNGKNYYIYRLVKKKTKNMPYEYLNYINKIEEETFRLPFSPRLLVMKKIVPKNKVDRVLDTLVRKKVLTYYNVLIERRKEPVAQQEHTIIIDNDGNKIVTTRE